MKNHNKLVRDNIPAICEANGDTPHTRSITDDVEYLAALCDKLEEEVQEVKATPNLDELADVLEVVRSIGKTLGYTPEQLETARAQKAQKRGGFEERVFLISTD